MPRGAFGRPSYFRCGRCTGTRAAAAFVMRQRSIGGAARSTSSRRCHALRDLLRARQPQRPQAAADRCIADRAQVRLVGQTSPFSSSVSSSSS